MILSNQFDDYVEPFAGGASVAIEIAAARPSCAIRLYELDVAMANFWSDVIRKPDDLSEAVRRYSPSVEDYSERKRRGDSLSTLIVNRCSHSGRGGGPIGGNDQSGEWKINARWNAAKLADSILETGRLFDGRASVECSDGIEAIKANQGGFVYADPPYYVAGASLYKYSFTNKDHARLRDALLQKGNWALTYDDHEVIRDWYADCQILPLSNRSTASPSGGSRRTDELLILPLLEKS